MCMQSLLCCAALGIYRELITRTTRAAFWNPPSRSKNTKTCSVGVSCHVTGGPDDSEQNDLTETLRADHRVCANISFRMGPVFIFF